MTTSHYLSDDYLLRFKRMVAYEQEYALKNQEPAVSAYLAQLTTALEPHIRLTNQSLLGCLMRGDFLATFDAAPLKKELLETFETLLRTQHAQGNHTDIIYCHDSSPSFPAHADEIVMFLKNSRKNPVVFVETKIQENKGVNVTELYHTLFNDLQARSGSTNMISFLVESMQFAEKGLRHFATYLEQYPQNLHYDRETADRCRIQTLEFCDAIRKLSEFAVNNQALTQSNPGDMHAMAAVLEDIFVTQMHSDFDRDIFPVTDRLSRFKQKTALAATHPKHLTEGMLNPALLLFNRLCKKAADAGLLTANGDYMALG